MWGLIMNVKSSFIKYKNQVHFVSYDAQKKLLFTVRFVEISGNDEIVMTTIEAKDVKAGPAKARFLFNSMVISPVEMKRSVYVVRVKDLSESLNSLVRNGGKLEHVFDF